MDKKKVALLAMGFALFVALVGFGLYKWKFEKKAELVSKAAISTVLPDAKFSGEDPEGKMAYYDRARQDSVHSDTSGLSYAAQKMGFGSRSKDQTDLIGDKLSAINRELAKPYEAPKVGYGTGAVNSGLVGGSGAGNKTMSGDVDRLELLMKNMKSGGGEDPEMAQLGGLMDKILALQNPELAKAQAKALVSNEADTLFKAIPAEIAGKQKVTAGSVVEIRLLDSVVLSGVSIPKGHTLFAVASFSNQRMNLEIKNIRLGNQVVPVKLSVFDRRDAMLGIFAPEAMIAEAVTSGGSSAISAIGISGFDLTTQLAGAGIDAAKSLLSKKIRRIKQPLKAGYALLLRDDSKKSRP